RIIRRIARPHADDLANAPIATAHERIGQRLGFLKGHHAFSTTVSISLLQAGSHCTIETADEYGAHSNPLRKRGRAWQHLIEVHIYNTIIQSIILAVAARQP